MYSCKEKDISEGVRRRKMFDSGFKGLTIVGFRKEKGMEEISVSSGHRDKEIGNSASFQFDCKALAMVISIIKKRVDILLR